MTHSILRIPVLLSGVLLASCVSLASVGGDAPQLYTLTAPKIEDAALSPVDWQLLVEPVSADAGLDTARIALKTSQHTVDYYAGASWTEEAPQLVQYRLVEAFENSGKIRSVGAETLGLRANYYLKTELRAFQAEYPGNVNGGAPQVRVRLNAKMIAMPQRAIQATKSFEHTINAKSNAVPDVVRAFNAALDATLQEVVQWTLTTGQAVGNLPPEVMP